MTTMTRAQPEQVMFNLVSAIMFVLLFRYVFGGAIGGLQGLNYANYLIPGIAVRTVLFSAGVTGFTLADDLQQGFIYRLRSLPMARSAVFGGRVAADTVNNTLGRSCSSPPASWCGSGLPTCPAWCSPGCSCCSSRWPSASATP